MQFFGSVLIGASALISLVAAQSTVLFFTQVPTSVEAGQTYTIEYVAPNNDPVTIILREGPSDDLDTVETLTTSSTGGTFEWTPSTDLVNSPEYALQITQGSESNFSGQFALSGGNGEEDDDDDTSSSAASSAAPSTSAPATTRSSVPTPSTTLITTSAIPTPGQNTTITARPTTSAPTSTSSDDEPSETGNAPTETTGAAAFNRPAALLLGAVAALAYLQ